MTKYVVNTLCILNQENPTPSKSMDIAINIIPVKKNKEFENFVLGIDNYQQCCEGFDAECTLGERFEEEKFIESIEVYIYRRFIFYIDFNTKYFTTIYISWI